MTLAICVTFFNQNENEIKRCLYSIQNQNNTKFTCIVCDDFSKENSELIEEICKKSNFKFFKNSSNKGVCESRNLLINKLEKEEWISFVDGDDYLENNYVQEFYNSIKKQKNLDIIFFNINKIQKTKSFPLTLKKKHNLLHMKSTAQWEKFYKVSIIKKNNIYFKNLVSQGWEDAFFSYLCYFYCKKAYFIKKRIYNYVYRSTSFSNTIQEKDNQEKAFKNIYLFLQEINFQIKNKDLWIIYSNIFFYIIRKSNIYQNKISWKYFYYKKIPFSLIFYPINFIKSLYIVLNYKK